MLYFETTCQVRQKLKFCKEWGFLKGWLKYRKKKTWKKYESKKKQITLCLYMQFVKKKTKNISYKNKDSARVDRIFSSCSMVLRQLMCINSPAAPWCLLHGYCLDPTWCSLSVFSLKWTDCCWLKSYHDWTLILYVHGIGLLLDYINHIW